MQLFSLLGVEEGTLTLFGLAQHLFNDAGPPTSPQRSGDMACWSTAPLKTSEIEDKQDHISPPYINLLPSSSPPYFVPPSSTTTSSDDFPPAICLTHTLSQHAHDE
jgi:hypothetical protein